MDDSEEARSPVPSRARRGARRLFDTLPERTRTRNLYLMLLGLVGTAGFYSLTVQLPGLVGDRGILPVMEGLRGLVEQRGVYAYLRVPSLLWLFPTDAGLSVLGFSGVAIGALVALGWASAVAPLVLWVLYLSLFGAGQIFTSYQWDLLLMETFFCSALLAPASWRWGARSRPPPRVGFLLIRVLLFKLMFLGGLAKVTGDASAWWGLRALEYHFETQPLPTPLSWYFDRFPGFLLATGTALTLLVELVVPWFLFAGRRARIAAAYLLGALQAWILLTGNYGTFNLLALVLCFAQLDDRHLEYLRLDRGDTARSKTPGRAGWIRVGLVLGLFLFNGVYFSIRLGGGSFWPGPVREAVRVVSRFRVASTYGLFGTMTRRRRELIVQGSRRGRVWVDYRFPYKPGRLTRRPPVALPYMPRLDWQMWFAALRGPGRAPWVKNFLRRLLQGSQPVLDLLEHNPFPDRPPRYVRVLSYRYRFSNPGSERWWTRSERRLHGPPLRLRNGVLQGARPSGRGDRR